MIRREDSLEYHSAGRPGKIEVRATKPCLTPREMRLAYLPGAAFPSKEIAEDPAAAFRYTSRGNLVGVVTNGTAVPGLGPVGPLAAKPMQEGVAVLFKRLADIDVFDLELDATDPDRFVETVLRLEPTFGGINLKDIRAPEGLVIYDRLREQMGIPVFHENLDSTAVVAAAALLNALELVAKRIDAVRVVVCGAGTVGTGCARLFLTLGVKAENLLVYDVKGLVHPDREDLHEYQRAFARKDAARQLDEGLQGADVFLGASAGGVLSQEMVRSMAPLPRGPRPRDAGAGDRLRGGAGEPQGRDRGDQPRPSPERRRRPAELPLHLPRGARRPGDADHLGDARGRGPGPGRAGPGGRGRGGGAGLRQGALHLRAGVPAAQAHRPPDPGAGVGRGGPAGDRGGRRAPAPREQGVPGEPHRSPGHGPGHAAGDDPERPAAQAPGRLLGGDERDHPARLRASSWRRGSRARSCSGGRARCGRRSRGSASG